MSKRRTAKKRTNGTFRMLRALILAVFIVALILFAINVKEDMQWPKPSPYDMTDFFEEGGRIHYKEVGRAETVIDVSEHNGNIDWDKVAADGVKGVMIRLGYRGHTHNNISIDEKAKRNLKGADKAGLKIGVYFFSQATNKAEAEQEAKFVIDLLDGRSLDYPVAYDMEEVTNSKSSVDFLSVDEKTACANAFCKSIERKGYDSMVYGNQSWLENRIDVENLRSHNIWYAQYNNFPEYGVEYAMWQYSESGRVNGIKGKVDMNLWMK